jgi:hypothetical protein
VHGRTRPDFSTESILITDRRLRPRSLGKSSDGNNDAAAAALPRALAAGAACSAICRPSATACARQVQGRMQRPLLAGYPPCSSPHPCPTRIMSGYRCPSMPPHRRRRGGSNSHIGFCAGFVFVFGIALLPLCVDNWMIYAEPVAPLRPLGRCRVAA